MKRLTYLLAALFIGGAAFISACTEEETIDRTAVLLDTLWETSVLKVEAVTTYDVIAQMDPCTKDDLIDFVSPSEYQILDSDLSCGTPPPDGILFSGEWNLDEANNNLELDAGYFEQIFSADEFPVTLSFADLTTDGKMIFDIIRLTQEEVVLEFSQVVPLTDPNSGFSFDSNIIIDVTLVPAP